MSLPRTTFSLSVLLALLGSGLSRPGSAWAWDHPVVTVTVQIDSILLRDHLETADRESFQKFVAESIIREAEKNFPCMEWRTESSSARRGRVHAKLQAVVVDRTFGQRTKVFLTYRAVFDGQKVQDLERPFDLEILGAASYPGDLRSMRHTLSEELPKLFENDRFRRDFNKAFIGKISIARTLELDAGNQWLMIPVDADSLELDPESPLVLHLTAPLCKKKDPQVCVVSLISTGEYESGPWAGALHSRVEKVPCCPTISLQEIASQAQKAKNLKIFLGSEHTHCHPSSLCLDGLARHPGVP